MKRKHVAMQERMMKSRAARQTRGECRRAIYLCLFLSHLSEAFAAIDRSVRLGLKRNFSLFAAGCANCCVILTGSASSGFAVVTAGLAALGLILESTLSVELLLTGSENELVAAFLAYHCFVFEHVIDPLFLKKTCPLGIYFASAFAEFAEIKVSRQLAPDALNGVVYRLFRPAGFIGDFGIGKSAQI